MKKEIEINERIQAFLNGDLSSEETKAIEDKINADKLFAAEIDLYKMARQVIADGAYIKVKNDIRNIHLSSLRHKRINHIKGAGFGGLLLIISIIIFLTVRKDKQVQVEEQSNKIIAGQNSAREMLPADKTITGNEDHHSGRTESIGFDCVSIPTVVEPIDSVNLKFFPENELQESPEAIIPDRIEEINPGQSPIPADNCRTVRIKGFFNATGSCNNRPTGSIEIYPLTVNGGVAPYGFSLDNINFRDTAVFKSLYPGSYKLYVRDANNCTDELGTAFISSYDCSYQAAFAPGKGETWKVPSKPGAEGTVSIFAKSGTLVYSLRFSIDETVHWYGTSVSGQSLPMGVYQFNILYSDGTSFTGNVTIVR